MCELTFDVEEGSAGTPQGDDLLVRQWLGSSRCVNTPSDLLDERMSPVSLRL
jgi:hypothetical protein